MRGTVQPGHSIFHYNAAQPLSQVARLSNSGTNFPDSEWPIDLLVRRWAIANMNRGELNRVRILKASTYEMMWKPAGEFGGGPSPVDISWFLDEYRGSKLLRGHLFRHIERFIGRNFDVGLDARSLPS